MAAEPTAPENLTIAEDQHIRLQPPSHSTTHGNWTAAAVGAETTSFQPVRSPWLWDPCPYPALSGGIWKPCNIGHCRGAGTTPASLSPTSSLQGWSLRFRGSCVQRENSPFQSPRSWSSNTGSSKALVTAEAQETTGQELWQRPWTMGSADSQIKTEAA